MTEFDVVWTRIEEHVGEEFRLIRGQAFTYHVRANQVWPSTLTVGVHKSQFRKGYDLAPFANTAPLTSTVRGPSYVFAILTDSRIAPHTRSGYQGDRFGS